MDSSLIGLLVAVGSGVIGYILTILLVNNNLKKKLEESNLKNVTGDLENAKQKANDAYNQYITTRDKYLSDKRDGGKSGGEDDVQ